MSFRIHDKGYLIAILLAQLLNGCKPISIAEITPTIPPPATSTALLTPQADSVKPQFAWFYKPPADDADLLMLAHQFQFFILTRGNEPERDLLLALGAQGPILLYIRFDAIQDPHDCAARPRRNQVAYEPGDFCRLSEEHPDWFLLNRAGERIVLLHDGVDYVMMDPANPDWREFFLERLKENQMDSKWDGVFLDNVEVTLAFREKDNQLPLNYPTEASYQQAVQGFLQFLRASYFQPAQKLLFANIVARKDEADWTSYIGALDGVMHEGWAIDWPSGYRTAEIWEKQMSLAEDTQALGKFIILVSQGEQASLELQQFAFASYLLINQGKAAFRYTRENSYGEAWLYANYFFDIGEPLGPRYQIGSLWRRDFVNATVTVNPVTHESQITLPR